MNDQLLVSTCAVINEDGRMRVNCDKKEITQDQLNKYAKDLKEYLLKISYTKSRSYDNSDDDRAGSSYTSYDGVRYYEIDPMKNSENLIVQDDKVVGVVFFIKQNNDDVYTRVFLFSGEVQENIRMGYSASHSSDWTYINSVYLVKRGEGDVPAEGYSLNFKQSEMYPSF